MRPTMKLHLNIFFLLKYRLFFPMDLQPYCLWVLSDTENSSIYTISTFNKCNCLIITAHLGILLTSSWFIASYRPTTASCKTCEVQCATICSVKTLICHLDQETCYTSVALFPLRLTDAAPAYSLILLGRSSIHFWASFVYSRIWDLLFFSALVIS